MTPREILNKSLNHEETSRIPIDSGSTAVTGMHVSCVAALREYYGLEKIPVKVIDPYQMLGEVDEELVDLLGIDTVGVRPRNTMFGFPNDHWKEWRMPDGLVVRVGEKFNTTVDNNGDILIYPEGDTSAPPSAKMPSNGYFFDTIMRQEPVDDANLKVEDNLEEFSDISVEELSHYEKEVEKASKSGRAVVASFSGTAFGDIAIVPAPFLKYPKGIRDIEEWYISTVMRQDFIHKIFTGQCKIALRNLEKIYQRVGDNIDVVLTCGTDFGTQDSAFCSVDTFRELYMPYCMQLNNWIHENTNWMTMKHSCGGVEQFINSFIESGFDILTPVQCSAAGMESEHLKKTYGDRMVFWGGGVDTQKTLPFGTKQDVIDEVRSRCEIFSKNGGFVFNTIHNIQARTPVENIVAMFDTVREFNND